MIVADFRVDKKVAGKYFEKVVNFTDSTIHFSTVDGSDQNDISSTEMLGASRYLFNQFLDENKVQTLTFNDVVLIPDGKLNADWYDMVRKGDIETPETFYLFKKLINVTEDGENY